MGKYFVWFPVIALIVIYILSVEGKHKKEAKNKTDHLDKLHVKHHHRAHMSKSVKRDLHKHFARNVPVNPSERGLSAHRQPGYHVNIPILYGNSKKEKRQIQDGNSSTIISQENVTSRVFVQQPALETNMTFNKTTEENKSQPLVAEEFSILKKITNNISDKNEQKTVEDYLTPDETKLKDTLSRIFVEGQENRNLSDSNSNASALVETGSLDMQRIPQVKDDFKESNSKESGSIESRTLNVQSILQKNIALGEINSNDSDSVKSRSLDLQPVSQENKSFDDSNRKESSLVESSNLDVQPIPQANTDLKNSKGNESALVATSSSNVQLLPQINTALNDSTINETPSKELQSSHVYLNPVLQQNTDSKEIKNSDLPPVESQTFDVQPVSKGNTTFSESSRNDSLSLESNSLDLQPVSQEDTAINESKSKILMV